MLAERNLQLEAAGKVGLVGSYVYDAETEKMQISAGYAAIYGFPGRTTEITYGQWRAHVHPEDVEGFVEGLQVLRSETYQERRGEYKVDFRIVRRDGETRWIESRGFILYDSDARAQRVIGVNIDVTERKRAELALAERNAQLALAASAARVGCYSNNMETGLIAVSEGYVAIHGLPEGTVHTTLSEWRTRVHPDDLAPFDALREQLFGSRQCEFTFDYRLVRADGGIRWIESRGRISYGEDGLPQQCIGINIDVTERKQAEAHLSDALSAGRVVAFEWDAATCRSQRSDNAEHILGIVQGSVFLRQVHPDDRRNFKTLIRNLSPGNPSYRFIFRFGRSDRGDVWLEEEAKAEFDTKGKLLRIKGLTRDITERKQIEEALKESEAALRERLEALPAAIFVTDVGGRVTYCNQAAADLWGKMPKFGEDRWCDLARLYHSDGTPMAIEDCPTEIALKGGRIVRNPEAILERADGTRIPIIPYPNPLRNGAGTIVGTLNMTVDISERKNAELALAERNMQFDLAEKAALVGSYAYDLDTKVVRVSEGYAALHGLPERTPVTTGHKWRASTHPEDVIRIERVWKEAFRAHRGEYDIEYRIVRDGKVRWIYSRSFVSYGSNGRAQRVVGVNIDITERKRAEEHQRLLVAELDHRVKNALATVSAIAAHTLDGSNSMEHFVAALDGRIRSMASSHELLSCRRWEGIPLAELLERELTPYTRGNNTEVDGPQVLLRAEAGQSMAFVLHELTTNAAKYGALSTSEGKITVRWHWPPNGGARERLIIEWQEIGGPAVAAPCKSGYGTSVIRELIPHELGGKADLTITPQGVRCRMEIPGHWVERETAPIDGQSPLVTRAGRGFDPLGAGSTDPR